MDMDMDTPRIALSLAWLVAAPGCVTQAGEHESPSFPAAPQSNSTLVYEGHVVVPENDVAAFRYQRRVTSHPRAPHRVMSSEHRSFSQDDRDGAEPLVEQRAWHDPSYRLSKYVEHHHQTGVSSSIERIAADRYRFTVDRRGRRQTREVRTDLPVVVGPTVFGFVLSHAKQLANHQTLEVAFGVAERAKVYPFTVSAIESSPQSMTVQLRAKAALVRWAVGDLRISVDRTAQRVLRYEGPIPPRDAKGRALTATVHYTYPEDGRFQ